MTSCRIAFGSGNVKDEWSRHDSDARIAEVSAECIYVEKLNDRWRTEEEERLEMTARIRKPRNLRWVYLLG